MMKPRTPEGSRMSTSSSLTTQNSCPSLVHAGSAGETGPLYTRLLATRPTGPNNGALLLTAEVYQDIDDTGPVFPIWRSDDAISWEQIGCVADQRFSFGNRYQPTLLEVTDGFAGLPAGAILLAGSAIPADLSETHLVLYVSVDGGTNWDFLSQIDDGGPAIYNPGPDADTTAIWEPDLFVVGDELVCAYADERYKQVGMLQVIVHRRTRDLRHWSDPVLDIGVPDRFTRPGMFVCTGQLPTGDYLAVFETVGPADAPVHLKQSADGLDWGDPSALGTRLESDDGVFLSGSPNLAWRQDAHGHIELIITGRTAVRPDGSLAELALYNPKGGEGAWYAIPLPVQVQRRREPDNSGYSHSVVWFGDLLVQATTIHNQLGSHDIIVASTPSSSLSKAMAGIQ
jgi:hypothetical protein